MNKKKERVEELEATESDLEYGRTAFRRITRQTPSLTASEVEAMRERMRRDREARDRFDESRLRQLKKHKR